MPPEHPQAQTLITHDVEIIGDIRSAGNIQYDGKLKGNLESAGTASFGKSANVQGNLKAEAIAVAGVVKGNIDAKDRIDMKNSANVQGDIRSKRLTVEDGVTFIGKVEVNPAGFGNAPAATA
ncbi:MAG: polymer-forming cytoskeletal protein, partial [Kiritimatiellaeota bacterium]|nr:polymer-forming cytoskeletal protein [Kiritimatiellota bacterium]